jgi:hypothetical protein
MPASQRFDENQNSAVQAARFQKQLHTKVAEGVIKKTRAADAGTFYFSCE